MSKRLRIIAVPLVALLIIYFAGPAPETPEWSATMPEVPTQADELEQFIFQKESRHNVKPDNEARIVWYDSSKSKTPYAIIYLHGFSASHKEGDPVHRRLADSFGCNLYLQRMADHGIDTAEALINFTSERYWESAKEALAIGKVIGEKVIIISTSTGSTVALALAAQFPGDVHALINLSPNIAINNGAAFILNNPWGLYVARMVIGGKYRESPELSPERSQYWYKKYRLEGAVQLQEMLESKMNEHTFKEVRQPCLTLYYYKNEKEQDPEVQVSAMLTMHEKLGTPDSLKRAVAIPNAGAHVLASPLVSKDVESVYREMEKFAIEILKMPASGSNL